MHWIYIFLALSHQDDLEYMSLTFILLLSFQLHDIFEWYMYFQMQISVNKYILIIVFVLLVSTLGQHHCVIEQLQFYTTQ